MERGQFKNFIEVFNEVSQAIMLENDIKRQVAKIKLLYVYMRGYLTEENRKEGDKLFKSIEDRVDSRRSAIALFGIIHSDPNVIRLKNFHAGYSDLKSYDLTEAVEVLAGDEAES